MSLNTKNKRFTELKHLKRISPKLKLLPCYYSFKIYKNRKLYFGNIFSKPQTDFCPKKTVYSSGFSFFSIKNSVGLAKLSTGFSIISLNKSYDASKKNFYSKSLSSLGVWSVVKSNFLIPEGAINDLQIKNFSVKSYRAKLTKHLSFPWARQDDVLKARLDFSSLNYYIKFYAPDCYNQKILKRKPWIASLVACGSFFKIHSLFYKSNNVNSIFLFKKTNYEGLKINASLENVSARENNNCATFIFKQNYNSFFNSRCLLFSQKYLFKNFFTNIPDFKNYLLGTRKLLPVSVPKAFVRFLIISYLFRNNTSNSNNKTVRPMPLTWIKSHYEILYNDYLHLSSTTAKLITFMSKFSKFDKKFFKNKDLKLLTKRFKNKTLINGAFSFYFNNLASIHVDHNLKNFFLKDLTYRRKRKMPYKRSRLSKYYKSLWALPDTKSMKTRRR